MVSICKFLNFISNILLRPVFSGLFLFFVLISDDVHALTPKHHIEKIEVAGPGYLNIKLSKEGLAYNINEILI